MYAPVSSDLSSVIQDADKVPIIEEVDLNIDYSQTLGFGAFSKVFKGNIGALPVAIKKLTTSEAAFRKEASLHYKLRHRNIVHMYGIVLAPERYLIVLDKISLSLRDLLSSDRSLSILQVCRIAYGVVQGLLYLHSQFVIHRDLKAANVLVDVNRNDHPYLCDFGLSEENNTQENLLMPSGDRQREVFGSPAWIAPELFKNWPCSVRSDIYSLGVLLWEMITRKYPFMGVDRQDIVRNVMRGVRESIPDAVPIEYAKLIRWCWRQNPEHRPKNATYIAKKLKLFKEIAKEEATAFSAAEHRI